MAIEALCIAEYKGMDFAEDGRRWNWKELPKMGGLALVRNGDQVLDALGLKDKSYEGMMNSMVLFSAFNLLFSWFGLSSCNTKFTHARETSDYMDEKTNRGSRHDKQQYNQMSINFKEDKQQ